VRRRRIFQNGEGLDLGLQVCRLVGRYQPLGRTVLPQWILNTEAAGMSETPVTAYQTSRHYKAEVHTHNISYFYCGYTLYVVSNNMCTFYGINSLRLFHCLLTFYASVFLQFLSTWWLRNVCCGCLPYILLAFLALFHFQMCRM
jgi:hypothetical protein